MFLCFLFTAGVSAKFVFLMYFVDVWISPSTMIYFRCISCFSVFDI